MASKRGKYEPQRHLKNLRWVRDHPESEDLTEGHRWAREFRKRSPHLFDEELCAHERKAASILAKKYMAKAAVEGMAEARAVIAEAKAEAKQEVEEEAERFDADPLSEVMDMVLDRESSDDG